MKDFLKIDEVKERYDLIRDEINEQSMFPDKPLSDFITFLEIKLAQLQRLKASRVVLPTTKLIECIKKGTALSIKMNATDFFTQKETSYQDITLEEFSKFQHSEVKDVIWLHEHDMANLNNILKTVNLKFA